MVVEHEPCDCPLLGQQGLKAGTPAIDLYAQPSIDLSASDRAPHASSEGRLRG